MARKALVECTFLIPIRRDKILSDGKLHTVIAWNWLHAQLYEFGGATRATELYEGWYIDPDTGERIRDLSRKYVVALPKRKVSRLQSLLRAVCVVFHQKSIYLSVAGRVEFIEVSRDDSE
jgi:hypothetical protein